MLYLFKIKIEEVALYIRVTEGLTKKLRILL